MTDEDLLTRLAALADDLGPALVPPGHDELLESIAETARSLLGAAACSIALLEDEASDEPRLVFQVAVGQGAEAVLDLSIPATEGLAGFVVRSGQPLMIDDVTRDPRFAGSFAGETGYVPRSVVAVPLETERGVLGVLEVLDPDGSSIAHTRGMELLGHFAGLAALSIEGTRIFRDLGRALFSVVADAAGEDVDLGAALRDAAGGSREQPGELAELAAIFVELRRLGSDERRAATTIMLTFLRYAAATSGATR